MMEIKNCQEVLRYVLNLIILDTQFIFEVLVFLLLLQEQPNQLLLHRQEQQWLNIILNKQYQQIHFQALSSSLHDKVQPSRLIFQFFSLFYQLKDLKEVFIILTIFALSNLKLNLFNHCSQFKQNFVNSILYS